MVRSNDKDEVSQNDDRTTRPSPKPSIPTSRSSRALIPTDKDSQPFFNKKYSSSSFSSFSPEAQQIEKDLGVY